MSFAAITNVDDDVAGKSGMEKRGRVVRFDSMESKYNFLKEDPSTNQKALPLWRCVGEMFESFVSEQECTTKVTASYMPLNKGRDKVAKLQNCKAKKLVIKGHVYHRIGEPAPEGNAHIEFKVGGDSIPDQWSFTPSEEGCPGCVKSSRPHLTTRSWDEIRIFLEPESTDWDQTLKQRIARKRAFH